MHSRIIQLETNPISETGKITLDSLIGNDYDKWFWTSVADYACDDKDHDETITNFINHIQHLTPYVEVSSDDDEQWIIFKNGFVRAYFESVFPLFKKHLQELVEKASIEALCGYEMGSLLYPLEKLNDDRFGIYIYAEHRGLITLNEFIREIESNRKYYIGGTLDYHF